MQRLYFSFPQKLSAELLYTALCWLVSLFHVAEPVVGSLSEAVLYRGFPMPKTFVRSSCHLTDSGAELRKDLPVWRERARALVLTVLDPRRSSRQLLL